MRSGRIKTNTPEPQPHVITEFEKQGEIDIRMAKTGTHKYSTRSSTIRVNHVTTVKNTPNIFKIDT